MKIGNRFIVFCTLTICAIWCLYSVQIYARSGGPPAGVTGAPGQSTCNQSFCHTGNSIDESGGSLSISNVPANYELNKDYPITVTISRSGQSRWGFELAVLADADSMQAGVITLTDETNTQLVTSGGINYIMHTSTGTNRGEDGPSSWSFTWTSPETDIGSVKFYAAGNAANNNGSTSGDFIYTDSEQAGAPVQMAVGPYDLTLSLSAMTPHVGQNGYFRVVDLYDGREVARSTTVIAESFDLMFSDILREGRSYNIDFFADLNQNGMYDEPSIDHAWRISVADVSDEVSETFVHNTNFTDIEWNYAVALDFSGMTPHIGQAIWARLVDIGSGREMSRDSVTAPGAEFQLSLPGVEMGGDYYIDFFADLNQNGKYDAPSTDHAWRIILADAIGDTTLAFSHNTSFTDIDWRYEATIHFSGMTPHVGQGIAIRAVDRVTGEEAGRAFLDEILAADFAGSVSGLKEGGSYNLDFFADLDEDFEYDSPPADHAWRIQVADVSNNVSENFSHNVIFTYIGFPDDATVFFENMTPHVGQKLFFRVVEIASGREVARRVIPAIPAPNFEVTVPGIEIGGHYNIDFAADLSGDGMYDAPGTDHAWRIQVVEADGEILETFTHNIVFTDIEWPYTASIDFTGMSPHVGETFYYRLVEMTTGREVSRGWTASIPAADFTLRLPGVKVGGNYFLDFFADHNENGYYDSPSLSEDHAWRLEITDATGNTSLDFSHNVLFTDIKWKHQAILNFTGMTPHVGQALHARITDDVTGIEMGRASIDSIPGAVFNLPVPGLSAGGGFNIDFFADLNKNGIYDAPGAGDHAWRIHTMMVEGDEAFDFAHSTDFTDIEWGYQATLNFTGMTPHIGQALFLRLLDVTDGSTGKSAANVDLGQQLIPSIPSADFSVQVPGLVPGNNYNIEFFADLNGNKAYDAPPTDHAWRIATVPTPGDTAISFAHSVTDLVDIQWDIVSDVAEADATGIVTDYELAQNYPNPFNPRTTIDFSIPANSHVTLAIFNILGQRVKTLVESVLSSGRHQVQWDGTADSGAQVAGGIYFYRMQTAQMVKTRKLVYIK